MCSWYGFEKCASFWGNVEYVEYVECFLNLQGRFGPISSQNIQHIQHIQHFPRKKHIFKNILRTYSTYSTLQQKEAHFQKKMLLTAVMLNVSGQKGGGRLKKHSTYSTYSTYSTLQLKEAHFCWEGLEHIQHIQHYSRKKFFFFWGGGGFAGNIFNIFNICPPPFSQKQRT